MEIKSLKVGSRESSLAVIQSQLVIDNIKKCAPELEVELVTMKTTGDKILDKTLDQVGGKGLFVKELDLALLDGRSDLSVHSLKDMPMEVPESLPILAFSQREDHRDVLVLREGLSKLPANPVIGTSSRRRSLQAAKLFPEAVFKSIRGNIQTRLGKLDKGEYDGLILAAAGLIRLGLAERIDRFFSVDEIIPSAGQGIMVIQGRRGDSWDFLRQIDSPLSRYMAEAERAFVKELDGGCSSPIAACASIREKSLTLRGLYYNDTTGQYVTGRIMGNREDGIQLGKQLAKQLREQRMTESSEV